MSVIGVETREAVICAGEVNVTCSGAVSDLRIEAVRNTQTHPSNHLLCLGLKNCVKP